MQSPFLPRILGIHDIILRRSKDMKVVVSAGNALQSILEKVRFATKLLIGDRHYGFGTGRYGPMMAIL